ncbi:MAG: tRNA (adenosine(37)-N6)-threonylcarbamoyltransferase complex ATPase subunit type 1 TsaE, partial [Bacteroidales bacterium]|nr:tRNA (adenosine(37)-N6)-threonylcarbamoyltransferase complex ATPase subunit type 1 TsaE [Bacteroidales bacterium]
MTVSFDNTRQLPDVADKLLDTFAEERFFAFFGKMGVGKTTLIKAICTRLGVTDNVCSPTFAIINQ